MLGWILPGLPSNRSRVTPFSARSLRSLRSAPGTVEESSSAESEEDDSQDDDAEAPGFETGAWIFGCEISNRGCHVVGQGQDTFKKCVGVCFREFVVIYYIYIL